MGGWALHRSSCGVGDRLGEWWTRVLKRWSAWPKVTWSYSGTWCRAGPNASDVCALNIQVVFTSLAVRLHRGGIVQFHCFLGPEMHLLCLVMASSTVRQLLTFVWGSCGHSVMLAFWGRAQAGRILASDHISQHSHLGCRTGAWMAWSLVSLSFCDFWDYHTVDYSFYNSTMLTWGFMIFKGCFSIHRQTKANHKIGEKNKALIITTHFQNGNQYLPYLKVLEPYWVISGS